MFDPRKLKVESLETRRLLCGDACNAEGYLFGDANRDGEVGFQDFLVLSANFGNDGDFSQGDFNDDGEVGFVDFLLLSRNFGLEHTPEPATEKSVVARWAGSVALAGPRI